MTIPHKLTKEQLLKLIDDLEKNPTDKVRIFAERGLTGFAALGGAAAVKVAAVAGAPSIFGFALVAATPVGWLLCGAAAAGAAAYALSRLIRNGAISEEKKAHLRSLYREREREMTAKEEAGSITDADKTKFFVALRDLISKDVISPDVASRFIVQVQRGTLPISQAFALIRDLLSEPNLDPEPKLIEQANDIGLETLKVNDLLERLLLAAEAGDVTAQNQLGTMYFEGDGVDAHEEKAIRWFHRAAEQGHVESQGSLGLIYWSSENFNTRHKSIRWLRLAGEQGHDKAQVLLGLAYLNGEIIDKDSMEALKWFQLAADQGNPDAQTSLGHMYFNGDCGAVDFISAVQWYRLSAEQGDAEAQYSMGTMYCNNQGVNKDDQEASRYFQLAADQGHAMAQCNLGILYSAGIGVAKDDMRAENYLRLAADTR